MSSKKYVHNSILDLSNKISKVKNSDEISHEEV